MSTGKMVELAKNCEFESVEPLLNNFLDLLQLAGYFGSKNRCPDTFHFMIRIYKQIRLRIIEGIGQKAVYFLGKWAIATF